jgi:hypothetical protein
MGRGAVTDRSGWTGWVNTRERLIEKAQPLLEPGEVVAHVIRAQQGPNRFLGMGIALFIGFGIAYLVAIPLLALPIFLVALIRLYARRVILATDEALVVVAGGRIRYTPTKVLDRLDLETPIGPLKGLWLATTLNGRRMYVVPRCVREVTAADADLDV